MIKFYVMKIGNNANTACYMYSVSYIPEEEKVLFPAGSSFLVKNVDLFNSYPPVINLEAKIYF